MIDNARRARRLQDEAASLAACVWSFEPPPEARPARLDAATLQGLTATPASAALSKAQRARG